jgi:hypothetical protein
LSEHFVENNAFVVVPIPQLIIQGFPSQIRLVVGILVNENDYNTTELKI